MRKECFNINLSPSKAKELILREIDISLVHSQSYNIDNEKLAIILIYEKNYERNNSTASLFISIDNINNKTSINAVTTGNSSGILGFAPDLASKVKNLLKDYIID